MPFGIADGGDTALCDCGYLLARVRAASRRCAGGDLVDVPAVLGRDELLFGDGLGGSVAIARELLELLLERRRERVRHDMIFFFFLKKKQKALLNEKIGIVYFFFVKTLKKIIKVNRQC